MPSNVIDIKKISLLLYLLNYSSEAFINLKAHLTKRGRSLCSGVGFAEGKEILKRDLGID